MTNHAPKFTSSSATGSFSETTGATGSTALHQLSGTMNFTDSDNSDTHTTGASLHSAVLSSGSVIPASSLAHFNTAMTSQIVTDSNGSGKIKWSFSDADNDFDFLSRNQTLVLTYDISVSDNHGGTVKQTVKVTVTGTDDKPVISVASVATITEQANHTLSFSSDTVHVALQFTDVDLTNTGHTADVIAVSASGATGGILPGSLGTAELMAFFDIDNVIKTSGSNDGTINTTFSAPDFAFDYLAAGEHVDITYVVQLDDHAGGVSTQNVVVTVVGTNDKPVFLSGPETAHLVEDQGVNSSGNLAAHGDLLFTDVDLSDSHVVTTTVTASRSGGGAVPYSNAALLAAFTTSLGPDSTGHLIGDVDWSFALSNGSTNFLSGGETLTLVYHVTITDPAGALDTRDVTITVLGTNHPVVITSGPESAFVAELADTTGSTFIDTTTTAPAGTLSFTDADTSDVHSVAVTLNSTSWSAGGIVPTATQTDLAAAVTTTLHDSTGTGTGSVDWNFGIADRDIDFLADGETLTVNYTVRVSDATANATQTVSVIVTGANDAVAMTGGPGSASVAEQANMTGSSTLDSTGSIPTGTLSFSDVDLSDVHTIAVSVSSAIWSGGSFVPDATMADLQTALLTALHDSTGTGFGGVDWSFSIPDRDLDFLSAGETLTVSYDVTVFDGFTSSTQTVTITATGALDPLVVNPATVEAVDTPFTDAGIIIAAGTVDLNTGGDASAAATITAVNGSAANVGTAIVGTYGTLVLNATGFYSYTANPGLDILQIGDHPTDQFTLTATDSLNRSVTTTLTFNVTGTDDAPIITAAGGLGSLTEDAGPTVGVNGGFETGDLTGWIASSSVSVDFVGIGGEFGNYAARLSGTGFLEQDAVTTAAQHYTLSFFVAGDAEASATSLTVYWDGAPILVQTNVALGFTHYTFDVIGDALDPTTQLFFDYSGDGTGLLVDQISISPTPGPAIETTDGTIAFSDVETTDTHTASFTPQGAGYVGAFMLDPVSESGGSGSLGWHFTVNNSAIQFLAAGQTLTQTYTVSVIGDHGAFTTQDVTIAINGVNDAPTAVGETIITNVGPNGTVDIQPWALAANDTDPDATDHLFVNSVVSSSGGNAVPFIDVFFVDDATPGGSFTYTSSDGTATSGPATATVVNNPTSATVLTGTSGDDIVIATNGGESLNGGGGNDILIGSAGAHVMSGGTGNDIFAFLQTTDGPATITDFNNTSQHDRIAVSASGFGGGLSANMDVSALFETSADDQFSGFGAEFHFDTASQTLYFSADGTTASAITLAHLQAGVVLNAHDLLIV